MADKAAPSIRFGVVGLGLMGERHCRIISELPGATLTSVCDHHEILANETAPRYNAIAFTRYDDMLQSGLIDAVVLCLPSSMHAQFGIAAAEAGLHLVVEKPIHSQSEPARHLISACNKASVICAVISQNRFSPGIVAVKRALDSGMMGSPVLARATVKWFRHDQYYTSSHWRGRLEGEHGGVLINQAVHSIDILQWFFGVPEHVSGYIYNSRPKVLETEDTAVAMFQWNSGLVATLEASTATAPGFDEAYEIQTPLASARIVKGQLKDWFHADGLPAPQVNSIEVPEALGQKLSLFYAQYLNILDAISDHDKLIVLPGEAVEVVKTIEKIYHSAAKLKV